MAPAAAAMGSVKPPALPALLLIRSVDASFAAALRQRFRVLDFPATVVPDAPRVAMVIGGGAGRVGAFLDAAPSLRYVVNTTDQQLFMMIPLLADGQHL
ncbi:unnamed protein product [Urochloa humidicola]